MKKIKNRKKSIIEQMKDDPMMDLCDKCYSKLSIGLKVKIIHTDMMYCIHTKED
jgi:hypothetical protein